MADDAQLLADAKKLPLGDQLGSSNWKVRAQALATVQERVGRAFSCEDEVFAEAGPLLAKAVGDSNANVMDKAVEALVAYLEKADEALAARIAGPAAAVLASKCLKGKPATVAKTGEACMLLIELEQQAVVIEAVLKAFGDKVPKVVLAAVDIIAQAVSSFGAKTLDPKPIMKALPTLFSHTQAGVRDKAKEVSVELCAYLGQGVVAGVLLDKMPAAMRKDVDAAIGELPPGRKQPSRWTRREAAERATRVGDAQPMDVDGGEGGEGVDAPAAAEEEPEGDAYEFATPVDILGPLGKVQLTCDDDPPVPFWDAIEHKKWGLRKAALDKVKELGSTPRLAPGDYGELCRVLRKILQKDSIVPVAAAAADVCTVLACGLRDNFTSQAKMMVPPLLERFKEKNIVMSKSSEESLRALAQHCVTLADVAEDVAAALDHKNPKVKRETAKLVRDVLEQTPKAVVTKLRDSILPACAKLAEAGDSEVREAGQAALVAFAVRCGSMGILDKVMEKLDDSRKKKIEEMVQEAIAAAKGGAGGLPAAAAAPAAGRPPSRQASNVSTASGSRPGTARSSPKALAPKSLNRPAAAAGAAAKGAAVRRTTSGIGGPASARGGARAGGSGSAAAPEEDLSVGKLSNEELEERMIETFGGSTVELLRSTKWQERVEAMGSVLAAVQALGDPGPRCYELVQCVAFLPGWSDKNFQVLNKEFEVLTHLARTAGAFGRRDAAVALGGLVDKIHELKHKVQVCEALTTISEAVGPQFVMAELHKRAAANKNPKVLAEALGWIAEAVPEFGLGACDVKAIIDWMKADLGSPNAPVRTKAMEVLGKCHAQLGPSLVDFLEGLKPAQLMALEEHFRQNPLTQVVPTRKVRSKKKGGAAAAAAGSGGPAAAAAAAAVGEVEEEDEEGGALNPDDLLPRTDISGSITPALLSMISSSNWKERNAGVDQVIQLLAEAAGRIQPNVGGLFSALKGRMTDSNRNLAAKVLQLLGDIARAMGPPFDKGARPLLFPAVANLSDNKKQVRDGVLYMLDAWIDVSSAATLFPAVAEAVANPKCIADGKVAGLQWLTKVVAEGKGKKGVDPALRAAAVGMADKAVGVRDAGAALLNELLGQVGQEAVVAAAGLLVSADKKLAMEALTKVLGGPVSASSAAGPAGAAAAAAAASRPGTAASTRGAPSRAGAASRPGTARPAAAAPAAPAAAVAATEAGGPILAYSESKAERARKYRPRPGKFEGVAPEEVELLQRELAAVASPDWYGLLFAKDFKRHLDAAEQLMASLSELLEEVQASLDLIFRWAVLRICDGNMQCLVKVLEMCKVLLEGLAGAGYQMTDYEALCLLPAVVEKAGHNQDRVRALHRDVLRLACSLHPPHKVVDFLVQGLGSKSNRTKIECCEEIGCIIEREGMAPVLHARSKPMPAVAALLKERDGATRSAALSTIEQAWAEEGEGVWKLLGRLEGREQDMVQEKLKRSSKQPRAAPETAAAVAQAAAAQAPRIRPGAFVPREPVQVPSPAGSSPMAVSPYGRPALSGSSGNEADGGVFGVQRQHSDAASAAAGAQQYQQYQRQAFTPPNALATPLPARPGSAFVPMSGPAAAVAPTPVPGMRPYTAPEGAGAAVMMDDAEFDARWMDSMQGISSPNVEDAVEHMKMLCGDIMLALQGAASPHMLAVMGQSADALFATVNQQLLRIFADAERQAVAGGGAPPSRGAKYALNIMLQGMNVTSISMGITQPTLRDSISMLLLRLLEEHGLLHFEEGATLVKAVNVLMLKILECSNRTYAFAALLQLLRDPPREVRQSAQPGALTKFHDLVVKCLIKLTKGLQASQEGVDLGGLLFNIHDFFLFLGVDEIRKRSSSDDKPLRMVKTILHELCKMLGYSIYQYTAGIPGRDADPQPIIFAYISLNLQTLSQSGLIAPLAGADAMSAPAAAPAPQAGATAAQQEQAVQQLVQQAMSDQQKAELKGRLKDVMSRLMQRDQSAAAMQELHVLRKEFPAFVERYIATTSDMFRQFIDTGLAQLAAAEAAGGGAAPTAHSSSSGESSGSPGGAHPGAPAAQHHQQQPEAVARRPSPVPPLALQRPPLSPPVVSPSGAGGSLTTPGGTVYSPSNPRIAAMRERMASIRVSSEGGLGAGVGASAAGGSLPTSGRSTDEAGLAQMNNSLESLQQRLASLKSRRASDQG